MEAEKSHKTKRIAVIVALLLIVGTVVATDLLLFSSSLEEEGEGRGLSRYWTESNK